MRFLLSLGKTENAWLETDRLERVKLIAASLVLAGAAIAGVALLIYSLIRD